MKTRFKTAFYYGIVMAILVIPGYFIPDFTILMFLLISYFAPRELTHALQQVNIEIDKKVLTLFNLAFMPSYVYLKLANPQILTAAQFAKQAGMLQQAETFNPATLLQSFIIYGITLLILIGYAIFNPLIRQGAKSLPQIIAQLSAGFYLSVPVFFGFTLLMVLPGGWFCFVLALVTPWVSDSAAYFSGVLWGKKPIVPALSPKKTYVGFFGSMIGTIIFYLPLYIFLAPHIYPVQINASSLIIVTILAAVIGVLIELGDWLASGIKRYCGIKDFSNLLPGHGGVIDRFDSTFFTFTAILTIALLLYFF